MGTVEAGRLAGKQKAPLQAVVGRRPQSIRQTAQEAAPGHEREQLYEEAGHTHLNHVWSYDFVMDETEEGRRLKMIPIVDKYSRECLSIEVERSITAEDVVSTLASLFCRRGEPACIRSDNGPEFIAKAIKRWLEVSGVGTLYVEPGSPWENAYSETFISRFSDELLKREMFADLLEAKVLVEDYRGHYNHHRPHSALGYQTPAEFVAAADLHRKVENTGKPEELESVLTLS